MAARGKRDAVAVAYSVTQNHGSDAGNYCADTCHGIFPYYLIWLGLAMIYLAALLGLYSAYLYFKAAMPSLSGSYRRGPRRPCRLEMLCM